ncbi:PDZ domain-containing protein 8-like [Saccostrea echinata]|uniref:PDZ domain-containing protein 8-like n=1 Tax=Saccostrea echinata TaxID=191078 RepID=UPI002A82B2CC|nr:PDZ domain-containing protein 8-like [Saccostrea echinata]
MLVTAILCSFILGIVVTLIIQFLIFKYQLSHTPVEPIKHRPQFTDFKLPKDLLAAANESKKKEQKESCLAFNLIISFLFRELKDKKLIRRWVIKKMNTEFAELMQKTAGRILEQITVQEFNLGSTFPVIKSVTVKDTHIENDAIDKLDIEVDLDYKGGFQLALGIDLVLGKHVSLSVTVTSLRGRARLQFSHKPYTHWSFSFYEEPQIDFQVESKYGGRATPQLTSLIITQIKRTIRKKHTLPNYKFRMKPFFTPPPPRVPQKDLYVNGTKIGQGKLTVMIKSCSRLIDVPADSMLYCTLSIDSCPWLELLEKKKKIWVIQDVEIIKGSAESAGLSLKEDFLLDKYEDVVVVDFVTPGSPADQSDIRKGDVLTFVNHVKVTNSKQAAKLFKNAGERFLVRIERAKMKNHPPVDLQIIEDNVSLKDFPQNENQKTSESSEDFVNISINPHQGEKSSFTLPSPSSSPQKRVLDLVNTGLGKGKNLRRGRQKSNTIHEAPANLQPASQTSPKPVRRNVSDKNLSALGTSPSGSSFSEVMDLKGRSQSDVSSLRSLESADVQLNEDTEDEDDSTDVIQTIEIPSSQNPVWNETFTFNVGADEKFLNVCVSCKIPEKLDKQNKVIKPSKVSPIGQVSLSLLDICLDCLMTLQGDTQQTVPLEPTEARAGASRSKFSSYSGHPGFDPNLCFGDITMTFCHSPNDLKEKDLKHLTRKLPEAVPKNLKNEEKSAVCRKEGTPGNALKKIEKGKHDLILTNFETATFCNYCGKKIWLKQAFLCSLCKRNCHKKCAEKYQTETICTESGPMKRSDPKTIWKPLQIKSDRKKNVPDTSSNLFSKFTQKKTTSKPQSSPHKPTTPTYPLPYTLSPSISPTFARRRNSAPNTESLTSESTVSQSGDSISMTQTQSSGSLQSFVTNLPNRQSDELSTKSKGSANSDYDTSDESDLEMEEIISGMRRKQRGQNLDEMVVMSAKEMGKELYAELSLEERKAKLDAMVFKLQKEIDEESENKNELTKVLEESIDVAQKELLRHQIKKSDEKVEAMMMVMLHYCAGLQYCLDQEQEEKQRKASTDLSSAGHDKGDHEDQPVKERKDSELKPSKGLKTEGDPNSYPSISVEVASSPEEDMEDLTMFPEMEDDSMHKENASCLEQDSGSSVQLQGESILKSKKTDNQKRFYSTDNDAFASLKHPEEFVDEEDILADVINTVTEIIEKSEGETDSSDFEDTIKHSTN